MAKKAVRRYRFIQLFQLALVVLCCAWLIFHYFDLSNRSVNMVENQTERLARSLSYLSGFHAASYIKQADQAVLDELVNTLIKEHYIRDAVLYNHKGEAIARSKNSLSLEQLLPLAGTYNTPIQGIGRRPYLTEIYDDKNNIIGYLRVTLEQASLVADANNYVKRSHQQIMLMFFASVGIGFFLSRVFSRKRRLMTLFKINDKQNKKKATQLVADIAKRSET